MKKSLSVAIIVLVIISLVGCGKQEPNVAVKEIMMNIEKEIESVSSLAKLNLTNQELSEFDKQVIASYGINLEDVEEGIIRYPMINLSAEEVAVIKVKDPSKASVIKEGFEKHVQQQLKAFENYVPKNYEIVKNHILKVEGKYIFLAISEDAEKMEEIFDNALK
ncbi:DUF4358 domain-containing protein [Crassaminicella thermophila]|uniref:DUF4358 domain-containing protein n=1 Tax=Crassaminicella thermophila TaxID=2599308 RepID=A0A5C0SDS6_CRATE|nr:DUF4358 domain-containing protein [Crassaminicella thermophila]QEK12431.1 DUF4358 domain-containing protein [Crassaminicella thermophila]